MPGAVAALAEFGVDPPGADFRGIGYVAGRHRAEALFPAGAGRGVRRTDLQSTLLLRGAGRAASRSCRVPSAASSRTMTA